MPLTSPIRYPDKKCPYMPEMRRIDSDRSFTDERGVLWIFPRWRIRRYICSVGVEHKTYWRTHWQQGRQDWVACAHEVF